MSITRDDILFSGDTGFFGRIVCERLRLMAYNVRGLAHEVEHTRIDISKPFDLSITKPVKIVIHAAGKAHSVPKTEVEKQTFYQVNLEGTKNLCQALERLDQLPESLIFISTVAVYGIDQGLSIDESHPLGGRSPYADSKIKAEKWLTQWTTKHGIRLSILRLPLIAGPKPPGNLGEMIKGIKSGRYLSIGAANARKSMVWAEDIAYVIPRLTEKGGVYNLTDGHHPNFGELEDAIAAALNKRNPSKVPHWVANGLAKTGDIVGSRFPINSDKLRKITATLTFDDSKARRQLGWNPTPVLSKINEIV